MRPVGHRVLVKPDRVEETKDLGNGKELIIARVDGGEAREQFAVTKGTVVAIGPDAWKAFRQVDDKGRYRNGRPWCKVGDRVVFSKFSGFWVQEDGEEDKDPEVLVLNDENIMVVLGED